MMYQNILLTLATVSSVLASTNNLPGGQQQLVQQPIENTGQIHFESTIRDVLRANKIIPEILDDFEPTYYLDISYKEHDEKVLLGNDIPVKSVSKRPVIAFHAVTTPSLNDDPPNDSNLTFTLALTDPDALSRNNPVLSEMCHWLITNLTTPIGKDDFEWPELDQYLDLEDMYADEVDEHDDTEVATSEKKPGEIKSYMPPGPPKKTGPHRYVFVLMEGDASNLKAPEKRAHWGYGKERHGVRDWSKENSLTVVGANFFFAQHKKQ